MSQAGRRDDPEEGRAARAKLVGVGIQTAGVLLGILGVFFFGGVFFDSDPQPGLVAPVVGFVLMFAGPALWVAGKRRLPATPTDPGTIILTGSGPSEAHPSDHDAYPTPPYAAPPAALPKLQHDCGAWNDPGAAFCKRCGRALSARSCPTCRVPNDPDAQFCRGCGSPMVVVGR